MDNIQKLLENKNLIKSVLLFATIVLLAFFPALKNSGNNFIENSFHKFIKHTPDSNIVLITIDNNDINQLGGWPIKRSYYALLINYLNRYKPAKIGLEVFLSDRSQSQEIYNSVLFEQITKSGDVILSSLATNLDYIEGFYSSDRIENSLPDFPDLQRGHINYLESNGLLIPGIIYSDDDTSYSFAQKLAGSSNSGLAKLNFTHSFSEFSQYTLLEFFNLVENSDPVLEIIGNKIIIIGVIDPSLTRTANNGFNEDIPGLGIHATALENIIAQNGINTGYNTFSIFLFAVLLSMLSFKFPNKLYAYLVLLAVSYMLFAVLFGYMNLELNYVFWFAPLLLFILTDVITLFIQREYQLAEKVNEAEILNHALKSKENILVELEKKLELDTSNETLIEKISGIKREIDKIEGSRKDEEVEPEITEAENFYGIVYKSTKIAKIVSTIQKVAPQNATVLILGESGSGKELVAKAIHQLSKRNTNKFIAVNCAALTSTLLESELFGHVKGSFTNAMFDKKGVFEAADGGTIFLDEIGETDENFQVKLLRVLQSGEIQKVGSTETKTVDVRIVAATNKNLTKLVGEKKFREDLYYRLNVINITLPSLAERKEDIPVLAEHFVKSADKSLQLSKAVIEQLMKNDWRGNVRELESVIKRAVIFAGTEDRKIIKVADLPEEMCKLDKTDVENLILQSLREKGFSHSSINEVANEFGSLSRTIVSENLRGIFLKNFVFSGFDFEKAVSNVSGSNEQQILEKVETKGHTYLNNINKDLSKIGSKDFALIRQKLNSKYKNLPQKYHKYLDEVIKHFLL